MKNIINKIITSFTSKIYNDWMVYGYLKYFYSRTKRKSSNGQNIMMYPVIGSIYNTFTEILLFHLLIKKGYTVNYYLCDGVLPACEILTKKRIDEFGKANYCKKCWKKSKAIHNASEVQYDVIKDSVGWEKEISQNLLLSDVLNYHHEGIDFGNIVKGTLYRYFKSSKIDDTIETTQIARKILIAALISYTFAKDQINKKNYKYIFFSHGIYSSWQGLVEYCRINDIDYICYDRAKTKSTANFNINNPSPIWDISKAWDRLIDWKLNKKQNEDVTNYVKQREFQKGDVFQYNLSAKEINVEQLKARLNIKLNNKVITLFTNLIWDAANVSRDIAFKDPMDWLTKTIEYYGNSQDIHLLIRTHPAEKVLGTSESYSALIKKKIPILPNNITILDQNNTINSFSVIDITDIGVVHTSTIGIEMAIFGKPVILISNTHYRNKGFTYDVSSEIDYFYTIDHLINQNKFSDKAKIIELARKYFYLMMFEYQKKMPVVYDNHGNFIRYKSMHFTNLAQDNELEKLIEHLDKSPKDFIYDEVLH